jgi:hypothetical protein
MAGRFAVAVVLPAALLAGCSGSEPNATPSASVATAPLVRSLPLSEPAKPSGNSSSFGMWMYTAQLYGHDISIYKRKGLSLKFFKTLTRGLSAPQGTVATVNGWWYVANGGHSNVLIYRSTQHGPKGPNSALDDFGYIPANVDVAPDRKLVAVSNASTASGGSGSVSVYLNRHAEPARVLTYGNHVLQGTGVAIDRHGNCFWSFNDSSSGNGSIVEFSRCKGRGVPIVPTIAYAGGLAFDQHGNLYYVDRTNGIFKCSGVANCVLFSTGFGLPVNINFDLRRKHLWVADATGYIDAVDPHSGQIEYSTPAVGGSSDPPFGIAPAPG